MIERQFREWLKATDTTILVCWDLGHIWDKDIYESIERLAHGASMLIGSCKRGCGVKRNRYLTSSWAPDSSKNSYSYPHNYSPRGMISGGFFMDAEHRALIRKEIARRVKEDKEARETKAAIRAKEEREAKERDPENNVTQIKFRPA